MIDEQRETNREEIADLLKDLTDQQADSSPMIIDQEPDEGNTADPLEPVDENFELLANDFASDFDQEILTRVAGLKFKQKTLGGLDAADVKGQLETLILDARNFAQEKIKVALGFYRDLASEKAEQAAELTALDQDFREARNQIEELTAELELNRKTEEERKQVTNLLREARLEAAKIVEDAREEADHEKLMNRVALHEEEEAQTLKLAEERAQAEGELAREREEFEQKLAADRDQAETDLDRVKAEAADKEAKARHMAAEMDKLKKLYEEFIGVLDQVDIAGDENSLTDKEGVND